MYLHGLFYYIYIVKQACFVILFCYFVNLKGQTNLVYNGDFETYSACPTFVSQLGNCTGWYQTIIDVDYINNCAPDMINSSDRDYDKVGIPNNFFGYSYANSGDAYI